LEYWYNLPPNRRRLGGTRWRFGWSTALQAGRSRVRFHNPSRRTMTLGLTQSLTEMSTRNISWG